MRKDLYYRLSVINIEIPPLRERKSNIPKLAESLVAKHSGKFSCDVFRIAKDAIDLLVQYDYPGNVRELENILVQAMFNVDSENTLTADLIALPRTTNRKKQKTTEFQVGEPFADYIEGIEKDILEKMFQRYNGNVSQCASALRMYYLYHFDRYDQLCDAIASYIHFYNCERYQKRLGCMTLMEFLAVGGK